MDDEFVVVARGHSNPAIELDGGGKHETIVVVGVLSDKIYAAGRAIDRGMCSEARAKPFLKVKRIYQRSLLFQIRFRGRRRICSGGCAGKISYADTNDSVPSRNV